MKGKRKLLVSILLSIIILTGSFLATSLVANAASNSNIIVHFYTEDWKSPRVYYWNAHPTNIETTWPGKKMTSEGSNWFTYTFEGKTKINLIFNNGGSNQTPDLEGIKAGEWWYKNGQWTSYDPDDRPQTSGDFRDETIYFVITTRFYDGDESNNVHCWDDKKAGNTDSDPAWRGDFKGLIQKLDYIKAMGFSAIWITPVVENMSYYDYHGYHAINFAKVDSRYESKDCTYQDLINACHEKGIKLIQDIVLNHTSNNGEENIFPLVSKQEGKEDTAENVVRASNSLLDSSYDSLNSAGKHDARYALMKNLTTNNGIYHNSSINYEGFTVTTGQFADDCVDLNTENPTVYNYLINCYNRYIDMGVDAFRIDTVKHISRLTFNKTFLPAFKARGGKDFFMFGECAARVHEIWNKGVPGVSSQFFTWKEDKEYPWSDNPNDYELNCKSTELEFNDNSSVESQRTSDNAFLKGNEYHTPDYSQNSGLAMIDFTMHWNFDNANNAYGKALEEDRYYNDSTWNVVYVDSHDYGPDSKIRYNGGTTAWAENLDLMFSFRGIPCVYYGSEIEFKSGQPIDEGNQIALKDSGRAYYGDNIEGSVVTTDYGVYSNATGQMATTLNSPLSKHIQRLNQIRRAIPALRKGQYSTEGCNGNMAFKRRFTGNDSLTGKDVDSFVCVAISGQATFTGIPNGTYVDAITGNKVTVGNGTLTTDSIGQANMRVYVLQNSSTQTGKIGSVDSQFLK
ncbi:starch-binding protein [Clostridium sp. MSJ-8]|uniref:alpha-amylase family glycosyl hydrolase n=1 Tax=Clostridium sp. MSJ-8 TaxID=2841510 RepID=UPI001C0EC2A8|nr:alpha-amylase family glycosyl hydrolase [Clostridium sp. MSJ-8]MBU5487844.1 starch-binding protein [Clostridium sp. MSJ-8]